MCALQNNVQIIPHLILLSRAYYVSDIQPLLTRWLLIWLRQSLVGELTDSETNDYLIGGPGSPAGDVVLEKCGDENVKILNLSRDWLHTFLPFVISKINRVGFGLLSPNDVARCGTLPQHGLFSK